MSFIEYCRNETELDQRRRRYLDNRKANYTTLLSGVAEQLSRSAARYLHAANSDARIAFTRIALGEMEQVAEKVPDGTDWNFITICPAHFAMRENVAGEFNAAELAAWLGERLGGLNVLGFIEAGLYPSWPHALARNGTISWHFHGIVWDAPAAVLATRLRNIRGDCGTFIPGVDPVRCQSLPVGDLDAALCYMLKSPGNRYKVFRPRPEKVDVETGEITAPALASHRQKKGKMRPGELVRMANVMEDQYLDGLLVAQGAGRPVAERIRERALVPLELVEDRQTERSSRRLRR